MSLPQSTRRGLLPLLTAVIAAVTVRKGRAQASAVIAFITEEKSPPC
jgi:hypothetical protein